MSKEPETDPPAGKILLYQPEQDGHQFEELLPHGSEIHRLSSIRWKAS